MGLEKQPIAVGDTDLYAIRALPFFRADRQTGSRSVTVTALNSGAGIENIPKPQYMRPHGIRSGGQNGLTRSLHRGTHGRRSGRHTALPLPHVAYTPRTTNGRTVWSIIPTFHIQLLRAQPIRQYICPLYHICEEGQRWGYSLK